MPIFNKKSEKSGAPFPLHIAVIMDGNGRWAKKRALPRSLGHKAGAENFKKITLYASEIGIKYFTVYAFSTENWSRPSEEVGALMKLFKQYLESAINEFSDQNIKVNFIGDTSFFPKDLQKLIERVKDGSKNKTGMVLNLALNYGGRAEIIKAVNDIYEKKLNGEQIELNEETLNAHLYTKNQPDPDLIIRPSGEKRLSNFLLWQCAYSEFIYFDILWPDFKPSDLDEAIDIYMGRSRRFGGV